MNFPSAAPIGRGLVAALALLLLVRTSALPAGVEIEPLPLSEIAPGVYLYVGPHEEAASGNLGAIGNMGFVVGSESVAVIDTGGSARAGARLRQALRVVTPLPIRFVINTHVHPDHVMGNAAFAEDAPDYIGHRNLERALAARADHYLERLRDALGPAAAGTRVVPPTRAVDHETTIDLGGRELVLFAHPAAHTDNDLTVFDAETGTLWAGDLLFVERVPVVDGSLKGWLDAMAALRDRRIARIVPGHGHPPDAAAAAIDAQERYLRTLLTEIRQVIADGGPIERAVATVGGAERRHWALFDSYHPRNVVTAFTELEWE